MSFGYIILPTTEMANKPTSLNVLHLSLIQSWSEILPVVCSTALAACPSTCFLSVGLKHKLESCCQLYVAGVIVMSVTYSPYDVQVHRAEVQSGARFAFILVEAASLIPQLIIYLELLLYLGTSLASFYFFCPCSHRETMTFDCW